MKRNIFILALLLILCGCDNSPMAKLKSDVRYPELESVWRNECKNKTALWQEAVAYCKQNSGKPNCADVNFDNMVDTSNQNVTGKLNAHPLNSRF